MPHQGPFVCTDCINEPGIQDFIEQNKVELKCSFCDEESSSAALLDNVAEHMKESLKYEYDDALEWFFYDREEGGYIGKTWDSFDLLVEEIELDLPNDIDGRLLLEIIDRLPGITWCEADPHDVPDRERVRYDWAWFSEVVMYRRRFFFENFQDGIYGDRTSPGKFLEKTLKSAENLELFLSVPADTPLFRARHQKQDEKFTTTEELGPPPRELANQSNRMSPPGIPMFYGCDHAETALRETAKGPGRFAVARFKTLRPSVILDLTRIPPVSSLFEVISETLDFRPREVLTFLNHVRDEISTPVRRNDRSHIDYIPTQVVTEFVRSKLIGLDIPVDGIKYWSAVHPGHASYVIFATQEDLLPTLGEQPAPRDDRWLELIARCEKGVSQEDIERWKDEVSERYEEDYQRRLFGDV